jgi:mono/diheme cytochrome c family protein
MSDSPESEHDDHAPEPAEITHPVIWSVGLIAACGFLFWLFFHCMSLGNVAARGEPMAATLFEDKASSTEPEPDHEALTKDASPETLTKGKQVFGKNCASCHGLQGDLVGGTNPLARNFHVDAFKNPNGGGPYALYLVVTKGYNAMPPFPGLTPVERYAAVQYIRNDLVKKYNAKNFVEADALDLQESMPKAGSVSAGPLLSPNERPTPHLLYPLMQIDADKAQALAASEDAWLEAMGRSAGDDAKPDLEDFKSVVVRNRGLGVALLDAAKLDNKATFIQLLLASNAPGVQAANFSLIPADRLDTLYHAAHIAAAGSN